jgi:hypothetical protein
MLWLSRLGLVGRSDDVVDQLQHGVEGALARL